MIYQDIVGGIFQRPNTFRSGRIKSVIKKFLYKELLPKQKIKNIQRINVEINNLPGKTSI